MRGDWNLVKTLFKKSLRIFSLRGNWSLAKTRFRLVLEYFQCEAIGIWQRQRLDLSWNIISAKQLEFGKDKI